MTEKNGGRVGDGRRSAAVLQTVPLPWAVAFVLLTGLAAGPLAVWTTNAFGLASLAPAPGVVIAALVFACDPRRRDRSAFVRWAALASTAIAAGHVVLGDDLQIAVSRSAGALACGVVTALVVTGGRDPAAWIPHDPLGVARLVLAAAVGAPVGVLLGAYPGTPAGGSGDPAFDAWNAVRAFVLLVVVLTGVLPLLCAPRTRYTRLRYPRLLPVVVVGTAACLALPYLYPEQMLSWVAVLPAVWVGMTMTPRVVAGFIVLIAVALAISPYPVHPTTLGGILSTGVGVDLLISCIAVVAAHIVVLREHEARMRADLRAYAEDSSEHRDVLAGVLASMRDGLLLTDPSWRVTLSNPAAREIVGADIPHALTAEWIEAVDLQSADIGRLLGEDDIRRLHGASEGFRYADLAIGAEAGHRRLLVGAKDLAVADERLILLFVKDTTAQHARQHELESFAGTVAHDLKSPLTGLRGWLEAATEEVDAGDAEAACVAVRRARAATDRMSTLIDDMLAHTVAHEGETRPEDVSLADVVTEIAELYTTGGVTVEIDAPHRVRADPSLTRQLLANLIGNSIKYARPGEPPFVQVCTYDGRPGWVEIEVSDRGRGLQPGDEERIFAAFDRSEKDAGSVQGIGLGLSLCHDIVTRHGGLIGAENNEWGGATFMVTLPAAS